MSGMPIDEAIDKYVLSERVGHAAVAARSESTPLGRSRSIPYGHPDYERRCCPAAQQVPCVCTVAFNCPEHGQSHHGTHD